MPWGWRWNPLATTAPFPEAKHLSAKVNCICDGVIDPRTALGVTSAPVLCALLPTTLPSMLIDATTLWLAQTNTYVIAPEAGGMAVVVDAPPDPTGVIDLLAKHNLTPVALLLTHGHIDHVGGAGAVVRSTGVRAYVHPADDYLTLSPEVQLRQLFGSVLPGDYSPPDEFEALADGQVLPLAGLEIRRDSDARVILLGIVVSSLSQRACCSREISSSPVQSEEQTFRVAVSTTSCRAWRRRSSPSTTRYWSSQGMGLPLPWASNAGPIPF